MRFSVITVCLNAGEDLLLTVKSTLKQTYYDYEIIIKDAFSKDGSIDQLPKDERIKVVQSKDTGIYDAMNQAIELSQGDYLIFMNAGDLFFDEHVLEKIDREINLKSSEIYYGKSYCTDLNAYGNCPPYIDKYFCYRSMICHQATVYSRMIMKRRGYNTEYKVSADRERLMYAVIIEKIQPQYVHTTVSRYKGQGFSESAKGREMIKTENQKLIETYYSKKERIMYGVKYSLTFPHIRRLLIRNKRINLIYNRLIGLIYRT